MLFRKEKKAANVEDNLDLLSSSRNVNECFASPVQSSPGHSLPAPAADRGKCLCEEQHILPGCKITAIWQENFEQDVTEIKGDVRLQGRAQNTTWAFLLIQIKDTRSKLASSSVEQV